MKRICLILLLSLALLLVACTEETTPATENPETTTPSTTDHQPMTLPADQLIQQDEPMTLPSDQLIPEIDSTEPPAEDSKPTDDPQPIEPPAEDSKPTDDPQPIEPPAEDSKPTDNPQPIEPPAEDSKPTDDPQPIEPPADIYVDYGLLTIENYDEYLSFLKNTVLPTTFVPYETVSVLGAFDSFVCLSDAKVGNYSHYIYNMVDETGMEFILYVEYNRNGPELTPLPIIDDIDPANMRQTLSSQKGRYLYEGIEYTFISTGLMSITWEDQGHIFTLFTDELASYPNADTLIAKLLDLSQVHNALSAFALPA